MVWPPFPMMEPTTELSTSMSMPPGCLEALVRPGACSWRIDVNCWGRGERRWTTVFRERGERTLLVNPHVKSAKKKKTPR